MFQYWKISFAFYFLIHIVFLDAFVYQSKIEKRNSNDLKSNREKILEEHNKYRSLHCVPALTLDDEINRSAQKYAEHLVKINRLEHSTNENEYGENLFYSASSNELKDYDVTSAVKIWYNEIKDYDFNKPDFSEKTGHFTQVVWKDSKYLGVGIAFSDDQRKVYIVAQYSPSGNYIGDFENNVLNKNTCKS